jgi:hypothetical protein
MLKIPPELRLEMNRNLEASVVKSFMMTNNWNKAYMYIGLIWYQIMTSSKAQEWRLQAGTEILDLEKFGHIMTSEYCNNPSDICLRFHAMRSQFVELICVIGTTPHDLKKLIQWALILGRELMVFSRTKPLAEQVI